MQDHSKKHRLQIGHIIGASLLYLFLISLHMYIHMYIIIMSGGRGILFLCMHLIIVGRE